MEQTFTSHLFSQALSSKEQRLAFLSQPEAPKSPAESPETPPIDAAKEKDTRVDTLKSALGDHVLGAGAMLVGPGGAPASLFHHTRGFLKSGGVALDTAKRWMGGSPEKKQEAPKVDIPVAKLDPVQPAQAPEATNPAPGTPDEKTAKEAQEAAEKAKKAETEKYEKEKAAKEKAEKEAAEKAFNDKVDKFVKDNQPSIDDLNKFDKENNKEKFTEKLGELNKKIDEIKDPQEKSKVLEALKTKLKQENFKVKVEQKLVIVEEPKALDVKPPTLDQKESMQSFVKDLIEAIKTFMKEFGLTKEDVKGIITNKPNAPTAPTAGLNAGNATAEQLTQAKEADAKRLVELEKRVRTLEADKNTPRGRAERTPNRDRLAIEREVREKLEQRRLDRELKRRLELERRAQELADRTHREGQRYGIGARVTMDRNGIRLYPVSDQGASAIRTIEQMAPQTFPGRIVRSTTDGSVIIPYIDASHNSGNINVGGIQQNFERSLGSAYERAPVAPPPSAPAPRVETPPAPKPPTTRKPSTSGSLE